MSENSSPKAKKPIYFRTWFIVLVALTIFGIIGALNPSKSTSTPPAASTSTPKDAEPALTFESKGCLEVAPTLLNGIGLGFGDSKLSGKAAGFKAVEYKDVKFIALEFTPKGEATSQIAIFGTNDNDLSDKIVDGLIVPVDGFAKEFSDWGDANPNKFALSISDKGAKESKECLALVK